MISVVNVDYKESEEDLHVQNLNKRDKSHKDP